MLAEILLKLVRLSVLVQEEVVEEQAALAQMEINHLILAETVGLALLQRSAAFPLIMVAAVVGQQILALLLHLLLQLMVLVV